jgi:hypothetical protein
MARYLIDSTALIQTGRRTEPFLSRLRSLMNSEHEAGICAINVAEFFSGLPPSDRTAWIPFIDSLTYWPIERSDAVLGGVLRYTWARRGRPLQTTDCLIAAVARRVGATIVTENLKDFPMPEVRAVSLLADEFAV